MSTCAAVCCCNYLLQLCDLYENDCIFDKFDCCMNGAATYVASGSYNNSFKVFKCADGAQGTPLEASRDPMRRRLQPVRVSTGSRCSSRAAWPPCSMPWYDAATAQITNSLPPFDWHCLCVRQRQPSAFFLRFQLLLLRW